MAAVDGVSVVKVQQLVDEQLISGHLSDNNHLILETRNGAQIDAGLLEVTSGFDPLDAWPVGSIFVSVSSADPSTVLGGGTWARVAQGRVLVSQDGSQTEFDAVRETGGAKTHTLTSGEMPGHTHAVDHDHASFSSSSDNNHTHAITRKTAVGTSTGVAQGGATTASDGTTAAATAHSHTIDVPAFAGSSGSTGTGSAHNNLQPYFVVYMWERTA